MTTKSFTDNLYSPLASSFKLLRSLEIEEDTMLTVESLDVERQQSHSLVLGLIFSVLTWEERENEFDMRLDRI